MVYYVGDFAYAWLNPACALIGIFLQIMAVLLRKLIIVFLGLAFVLAGALMDRDLALAVGDSVAVFGLWICIKKRKKRLKI